MANGKKDIFDRLGGDKIVWLIVLLLMTISLLGISSATSSLAGEKESRMDIIIGQVYIILIGLAVILGCYVVPKVSCFKWISKFGFFFSFVALVLLDTHSHIGPLRAATINGAWRIFMVKGFQIHILEVVKVYMVMYTAWAIDNYKNGQFKWQENLAKMDHLEWLKEKIWLRILNIHLPMITIFALAIPAGTTNALFIAGILFLTIMLAGVPLKDLAGLAAAGAACACVILCLYAATKDKPDEKRMFKRLDTALSDSRNTRKNLEIFLNSERNSQESIDALSALQQTYGAPIAIKQGGLSGKGPGNSTMKYVIPIIYADYMYSFLIEEYGLLIGGIGILALYISLLARGAIIARKSEDLYAKIAVAGLSALIVGQAMMHIVVNSNLGINTGQTMPLVSYGKSAFLCFSFAFGVILSLSRKTTEGIEKMTEKSESLMEYSDINEEDNLI